MAKKVKFLTRKSKLSHWQRTQVRLAFLGFLVQLVVAYLTSR